ncbi:hypothetical protein QEJ31_05515 [Pigmentibacter sp. JX0631]|uniref:hypothetical protein n=1 Tax=Pigmentibacter sp. JX0631 TaxID=2976982 RepID=UPI002469AD4A|nr:hypothetical protein [Pigmentibacter sp. JX0631]WGL61052.1 hypothetical protein QEJ31_05515 [Pigmentibacter sp. JX0631]
MNVFLRNFLILANFLPFCTSASEHIEVNISAFNEPIEIFVDGNTIFYSSLPKNLVGQVNFQVNTIGTFYPSGITDSNCELVESRAKNAVNSFFPNSVRVEQRNLVRKYGSVKLKFSTTDSFYSKLLKRRIVEKISEKLNNNLSYDFKDNFQIDEASFVVEYDKNAISNIIDNKEEINKQLFKVTDINLLKKGSISVELNSSDFICDLHSGKAKIKLIYQGKYGIKKNTNYILSNSEIEHIILNLNNNKIKYFEPNVINSKEKNLILSSLLLKESLQSINRSNLDIDNFFLLLEQITNQDDGKIYSNLSSNLFTITIGAVDNYPYKYTGTLNFEIQKPNLKQTQ